MVRSCLAGGADPAPVLKGLGVEPVLCLRMFITLRGARERAENHHGEVIKSNALFSDYIFRYSPSRRDFVRRLLCDGLLDSGGRFGYAGRLHSIDIDSCVFDTLFR